jgi:hypothetical protein
MRVHFVSIRRFERVSRETLLFKRCERHLLLIYAYGEGAAGCSWCINDKAK